MSTITEWAGWSYITIGACAIGLVAAVLFVVMYQVRAGWTWWRWPDGTPNHFGRFLMIRKILLSALFVLILTNRFLGDWAWRLPVTAVLMAAFALQTFVPYRLLMEAQQERAQGEEARQ